MTNPRENAFQEKKVSCHSNSVLEPPHRPNLAELYLLFNCTNYSFDKRKEDVKLDFAPTMCEELYIIFSLIIIRIQQRRYYHLQF